MDCTFDNELGNSIYMSVTQDDAGVHVTASGPTSTVEHTWTRKEFLNMIDMYSAARDGDIVLD